MMPSDLARVVISTAVQPKAVMFRALEVGRPMRGCARISMPLPICEICPFWKLSSCEISQF